MRIIISILCLMMFLPALNGVVQAENFGFETGDFTGWETSTPEEGSAEVVTSHEEIPKEGDSSKNTYYAMEGDNFALLKTGGVSSGNVEITVSQTIPYLGFGETLSGYAAFDAGDEVVEAIQVGNDYAFVRIYSSSNHLVEEPWYKDVSSVGDFGWSDWEYWEWSADASYFNLTLVYGVVNHNDPLYDSYAMFDAVSAVPLPGSVLLLGSGLLGLGLMDRRRKRG